MDKLFKRFGKMRVMVEMNKEGLFSAYTAAPMVGNVDRKSTPEEALNELYEKMEKANYFNGFIIKKCKHVWQNVFPLTFGQIECLEKCINCEAQKTSKIGLKRTKKRGSLV